MQPGSERSSPITGMDWLRVFLGIRRDVLVNPSDTETADVWRASAGRVDVLRTLVEEGRSQLQPPITVNPFGRPHPIG